jgi:hypothetical protein
VTISLFLFKLDACLVVDFDGSLEFGKEPRQGGCHTTLHVMGHTSAIARSFLSDFLL